MKDFVSSPSQDRTLRHREVNYLGPHSKEVGTPAAHRRRHWGVQDRERGVLSHAYPPPCPQHLQASPGSPILQDDSREFSTQWAGPCAEPAQRAQFRSRKSKTEQRLVCPGPAKTGRAICTASPHFPSHQQKEGLRQVVRGGALPAPRGPEVQTAARRAARKEPRDSCGLVCSRATTGLGGRKIRGGTGSSDESRRAIEIGGEKRNQAVGFKKDA